MELNPYAKEVSRLEVDRENLVVREELLRADIDWQRSFDLGKASAGMEELGNALIVLERNTKSAEELEQRLRAEIDGLRSLEAEVLRRGVADVTAFEDRVPTIFNPLNWFGDDRAEALKMVEAAQRRMLAEMGRWAAIRLAKGKELARHGSHLARMRSEGERIRSQQGHVGALISRHQDTNLNHLESMLAQTREATDVLDQHLAAAVAKRDRVEQGLRGIRPKMRELEEERHEVEWRLAQAMRYDDELDDAGSSYDRAMIHEQCASALGDSKPGRIISDARRSLAVIERKLTKLRQRADQLVAVASRTVRTVVFDGNNLCYQNDQFVGVGPVVAAARALKDSKSVVVVFDRSIVKRQSASVPAIRAMFDGLAEVHVVQGKRQADETVLDIADADDSIVVSNDRFIEFGEKKAQRDGRLVTHEIAGARVMIPDLGVSVSWGG